MNPVARSLRYALVVTAVAAATGHAAAAQLHAGPSDYRALVPRLRAGDTLVLAQGLYPMGLDVRNLAGTAEAPIAIVGTREGIGTVFVGRPWRNTISIADAAYVRIADLELRGNDAPVDAVKAEGTARFAHDVVLERLVISGYARSQQNVAISTKCPAWNWTIRDNTIHDVGTGLYLGDSDGSAPFVRGVIEGNVVTRTLGYALQIKHQLAWPDRLAVSAGPGQTVIRFNTFAKDERSSGGALARPSVLLGHWPLAGRGAGERYLLHDNLFLDNPTEALLQAEGNVALERNVFVNRRGDAIALREHHDVPRHVTVDRNSIAASGTGLLLRNAAPGATVRIERNAIWSPRVAPADLAAGNRIEPYSAAVADLLAGVVPRSAPGRTAAPGRDAGREAAPAVAGRPVDPDRDFLGREARPGDVGALRLPDLAPPRPGRAEPRAARRLSTRFTADASEARYGYGKNMKNKDYVPLAQRVHI